MHFHLTWTYIYKLPFELLYTRWQWQCRAKSLKTQQRRYTVYDHLFSMESMLEWSSHSSSVLSCLEERIRWWPVKHRVPSTVGMKGRCRTTPSTLGVFINSANSIPWPDQKKKKDDSYFKDWFQKRVWNLHQTYGESYRWLTVTATTVCWLNIAADFVQMGANESRTDKWFMK